LNTATAVYDSIGSYDNTNSTVVTMPALTDNGVNTNLQPYSYKVLATDLCGNQSAMTQAAAHTSVFLSGMNNNNSVSLNWTPYGGCSVDSYNIYRDDAGTGVFQLIGTVPGFTTIYTDESIFCPFLYHYKVEAVAVCGEQSAIAYSNTIGVDRTSYQWSQSIDLTRGTVVNNSYVLVEWHGPLVYPQTVIGYDIYRSADQINYTLLSRVSGNQLYFEDHSANVDSHNYFYKICAVNYCDIVNSLSDEGSSILLRGIYSNGQNRLRWTAYSNWIDGVDHYVLERMNDFGVWEQLKIVDGSTQEAED
jgi:hypothetical protein